MREGVQDTGIFFVDNKVSVIHIISKADVLALQYQLELFLHKPLGLLVCAVHGTCNGLMSVRRC